MSRVYVCENMQFATLAEDDENRTFKCRIDAETAKEVEAGEDGVMEAATMEAGIDSVSMATTMTAEATATTGETDFMLVT